MNDYLNGHPDDWYARFVLTETDGLAAALATDPDALVASCDGWTVARLTQHVGSVHRWAMHVIEHGEGPADRGSLIPPPDVDLGNWLRAGAERLVDHIGGRDPEAPAWNPWPIPQIAGVWPRRMANETALHRWDADAALHAARPIDAELASDGIDEYFRWAVPRKVGDGVALPQGSLHVHCTDTIGEWLISDEAGEYRVVREHAKGEAALRGAANDLLLVLWGRAVRADAVEAVGDQSVANDWLALGGL